MTPKEQMAYLNEQARKAAELTQAAADKARLDIIALEFAKIGLKSRYRAEAACGDPYHPSMAPIHRKAAWDEIMKDAYEQARLFVKAGQTLP